VNGTSRVIGGSSLWGYLIDTLLNKYHWTFDYLLWGISYLNLNLLIIDTICVYPIRDKNKGSSSNPNSKATTTSFSGFMGAMKQFQK